MASDLNKELSEKTSMFGLKVWVLMGIFVGVFIVVILVVLWICLTSHKKSKRPNGKLPLNQIPTISKEIKEIKIDQASANNSVAYHDLHDKYTDKDSNKLLSNPNKEKMHHCDNCSQTGSSDHVDKKSKDSGYMASSHPASTPSSLSGLHEFSHLGWCHWFTLRELHIAANRFSKDNIIGDGGYGVVYRGFLVNGTPVAIKRLLNNLGQAEKEFRAEVEAIGHARHKNLVRLLGYCIEGTHRLLVYEYVNNGNLEQWLHGTLRQRGYLTWEARMKVLIGTAKALAYLHESIEPKVVHRDIKSGNILIDDDFNAKVSDFGLAKLLGSGKSHITTRVMGTFGYVAPEYASSGLLNEKSDVYSFGVLLLETITGRDPVDYGRPVHEVNLVDWLKVTVGNRRLEEVVDLKIEARPSTKSLKRVLLTALRCVDPNAEKRPSMSQVVRMLESKEYPIPREDGRLKRSQARINGVGFQMENFDVDRSIHS